MQKRYKLIQVNFVKLNVSRWWHVAASVLEKRSHISNDTVHHHFHIFQTVLTPEKDYIFL